MKLSKTGRSIRSVLLVVLASMVTFQVPGHAQRKGDESMLTYLRGQGVEPVYSGWLQNPDGTYDLHFSYINRNWQEEVDVPIGPDNNFTAPYGPDAGQPTHFYPRDNRWVFIVKVPKDFGDKEVVWTLTAHGETNRAYGTLKPGYVVDEALIQHEFNGGAEAPDKPKPMLTVDSEKQRTVKVGQSIPLVATAIDPFVPPPARARRPAPAQTEGGAPAPEAAGRGRGRSDEIGPGQVGGDFIRSTARGLWMAWLVYRGVGANVKFDPPIPFKVWEDQRGGSPWAPGFRPPPVPPGNKWLYNVTFSAPGTYVLRAEAFTGNTFNFEHITFIVTP